MANAPCRFPVATPRRRAALLSLSLLAATVILPVEGRAANGFWKEAEGDEMKVGLIFPDYSPSEYVGMVLYCGEKKGTVGINVMYEGAKPPGEATSVAFKADDKSVVLRGTVAENPLWGSNMLEAEVPLKAPLLTAMAKARQLTLNSGDGQWFPLPRTGRADAVTLLRQECQ